MRISPMKLTWAILASVAATAAAATVRPDVLPGGLRRLALTAPYAELVALRGWEAMLLGATALFFLIIGIVRRVLLQRGRIAFALAAVLAVCSVFHAGILITRGFTNHGALPPDRGVTARTKGDGSVTVMQYNTEGGRVPVKALADLVERNGVDVVTLVETSTGSSRKLAAELESRGLAFARFDNGHSRYAADWGSTVVLVSKGLGEYAERTLPRAIADADLPAVAVGPVSGKGPSIVAVHTVAPTGASLDGRRMSEWKEHIAAAYGVCRELPGAILAGDFNSTADHELVLGGTACRDAAAEAGSGAVGTWPSNVSPLLGAPIDRIMSPAGYRGDRAAIVDAGGSDHRGLIVRLHKR
jgi:endonuclease/exonuclease/phosphatase